MVEPEPVGYMYDYGTSSQMQSQESINMDKLFICMAVQLRSQSLSKALHTAASHSEWIFLRITIWKLRLEFSNAWL